MAEIKIKRKRVNLDEQEKRIFWNILKNSDNGKNWKIIYESTGNNLKKHDAWEKVTEHFNHVTNKTLSVDKMRQQYSRLKGNVKKSHDEAAIRNFNRDCSTTGGGPGVQPPGEVDGDQLDDVLNDLEPTDTPFNSFTTAAPSRPSLQSSGMFLNNNPSCATEARGPSSQIQSIRIAVAAADQVPSIAGTSTPPIIFQNTVQQLSGTPQPLQSPFLQRLGRIESQPHAFSTPPPTRRQVGDGPRMERQSPGTSLPQSSILVQNGESLDQQFIRGIQPRGIEQTSPNLDAEASPSPRISERRSVVFIDENGMSRTVQVEPPEQTPRREKKKKAPNMNEEAGIYYSTMLEIHKKQAELKMKLLRKKIKTEELRGKVLLKQLGGNVSGSIDVSDVPEDSDEDESEESLGIL